MSVQGNSVLTLYTKFEIHQEKNIFVLQGLLQVQLLAYHGHLIQPSW